MDFNFSSITSSLQDSSNPLVSNAGNLLDSGGDLSSIDTGQLLSSVGGIDLGGLGTGVQIAEAASGDPQAILALATNPQKVIDFAKNYNPIALQADLTSIFTANGVDSSFFDKFPFAKFLDNSTYHWKSRQGALRSMTPVQRVSWFIKGFNDGGYNAGDAILYNDFFGKALDQNHHISYDAPQIPYQLAATYNAVLLKTFFGGDRNRSVSFNNYQNVTIDQIGIDLTATKDYTSVLTQIQQQAQSQYNQYQNVRQMPYVDSISQSGSNNKLYILVAVVLAIIIVIAVSSK